MIRQNTTSLRPIKREAGKGILTKTVTLLGFAIMTSVSVVAYSQQIDSINNRMINMYNYGIDVTSCECNFENLLLNWDRWIANRDEVKLLSYEYVEQLHDADKIAYYINLICGWEATVFNTSGKTVISGRSLGAIGKEFKLTPTNYNEMMQSIPKEIAADSVREKEGIQSIEQEFIILKDHLADSIKTGDKVFLLKFKSNNKIYNHYVLCRPGENTVLPFGGITGVSLTWREMKAAQPRNDN